MFRVNKDSKLDEKNQGLNNKGKFLSSEDVKATSMKCPSAYFHGGGIDFNGLDAFDDKCYKFNQKGSVLDREELIIEHNLPKRPFQNICIALRYNTSIKKLTLQPGTMRGYRDISLQCALSHNETLESLILDGNKLKSCSLYKDHAIILLALSLEHDFHGFSYFVASLENFSSMVPRSLKSNLSYLSLIDTGVDDQDAYNLIRLAESSEKLISLKVGGKSDSISEENQAKLQIAIANNILKKFKKNKTCYDIEKDPIPQDFSDLCATLEKFMLKKNIPYMLRAGATIKDLTVMLNTALSKQEHSFFNKSENYKILNGFCKIFTTLTEIMKINNKAKAGYSFGQVFSPLKKQQQKADISETEHLLSFASRDQC